MATDFSSLDKLIEFGLGIGLATQMMNTMNSTIARTAIPGVGINPGVSFQPENIVNSQSGFENVANNRGYYVVYEERLAGPLNDSEIEKLIKNNKVDNKTFCWYPGLASWKLAEDIPEVNKLLLLNSKN